MKTTLTRAEYCQLRLLKARADNLNRELDELVDQGEKILDEKPGDPDFWAEDLLINSTHLDLDQWMQRNGITSEVK